MRAILSDSDLVKFQTEVELVDGNPPETIEFEGVKYSYCGIQDGFAYYSVQIGITKNSSFTDALSELERIGTLDETRHLSFGETVALGDSIECSHEKGCGIPRAEVKISPSEGTTYLGDSTSIREENGVSILSHDFSDGRKIEIRLDPEVLGNLIDWAMDKCSNSVIIQKLESMISNPPGFGGIHCELGHVGNKYVDEGWKAGLEEFKKFLLAGKGEV